MTSHSSATATRTAPSAHPTAPGATGARSVRDSPWAVALLATVLIGGVLAAMAMFPEGVAVSPDPGYRPMPVHLLLVPTVLCITLTILLPAGAGSSEALVRRPGRARGETAALVGLAVGFTLLVPVLPLPEDYVLLKALMFMLVPCLGLWWVARRRGPSVVVARPEVSAAVIMLPALLVGVLSTVGPFSNAPNSWPPLAVLLVGATATAITAGVGEELLFRRFLQTRLEALWGRWTGILAASLLFGLMHVFSHGGDSLGQSAVLVITLQGTLGFAMGLLWSRWRRLWVCMLAHLLVNGLGVVLHLLGLGG